MIKNPLILVILLSVSIPSFAQVDTAGVTKYCGAGNEWHEACYSALGLEKEKAAYHDPTGTLDTIQGFIAYGWSYDPDVPSQSIEVRFYVDGTNLNGTFSGSVITDVLREDVNQTFGITGNHGFRWFIPQQFRDGEPHSLYVYGIDTSNPDINILLNEAPKQFLLMPSPVIVSEGQPYNIGAWYFTAWSPLDTFHTNNTYRVYGRYDVWGGVRDHALGADPWELHMDYSDREPLLGFYNLLDQNIMDSHISQAINRGLSFFAFYWYWNTDSNQEDGVSIPLHQFISSSLKSKIKFLIAPIKLGTAPMTLSMWEDSVVPFMMSNYISDSSYLKTNDDRPVLILFDLGFSNNADLIQAISLLRDSVIALTNKNPVLLWLYQEGQSSYDLEYIQTTLNIDGFAGFQLGPITPAEPYELTLSRWSSFTSEQHGFFYFTCASTGFDRRPWWQIGWGYPGEGVNDRPYNTGISLLLFAQHLRTVKGYLDEHPIETSKTLIVYAWNEWGEGGIIEPSVVHQYEYLDTIKSVFGLSSVNDVVDDQSMIPSDFALCQNYPNPFNSQTVIEYTLSKDCWVKITIYNILGQKVRTITDQYQAKGQKKIGWDVKDDRGNELTSGIYFYRLVAGTFSQTKKMVLIR